MTQMTIAQAMQIALQNHQAGRLADAEEIYRQILAQQPQIPEILHLLGTLAAQTQRYPEAADLIQRALAIRPDWPEPYSDLGNVLRELERLPEALAAHQRAISLRGDYAEAFNNLAVVLIDMGDLNEAIAAAAKAVELKPGFPEALFTLGTALRDSGRVEEALQAHQRAMDVNSDSADARWNLAVSMLHAGEFQKGWQQFQWRFEEFLSSRPLAIPQWRGEDVPGKRILIRSDPCGFGDVLQFVRYTSLVADRGARVVLECQPQLKRLLKNCPGVEQVIETQEPPPDCDMQVFLLSLPIIFQTEWNSIPANVPYVKPEPNLVEEWRKRIGIRRGRMKIGLVWAGGPTALFRKTRTRSMTLEHLAPLGKIKDVEFFNLQVGEAGRQTPPAGMELIDFTSHLTDFAQTAALVENMDLIITVDTSMAHLAGAMGKRVWVILPFVADWRWPRNRSDNPWYPTMRQFRQPTIGDWAGAIGEVANQLQNS